MATQPIEFKNLAPGELLDLTKYDIDQIKIDTKYCVSEDVHDAHVALSLKRGLPPVDVKLDGTFYEPMALVCSGPSLADQIGEIRKFSKILTCSGAHDFLIENGIVPTWHMEADPRKHKVKFVSNPHPTVQYLLASSCHPVLFDTLKDHTVKLWHVLAGERRRPLMAPFPRGHWFITGGSNVGMRALVLGRMLGYTNIHIFGMDCSARKAFHVGEHPNEPRTEQWFPVRIGPLEYQTSQVFLAYAQQFFKEISKIPDLEITLHGDGLLQALSAQKMSDPEEVKKQMLMREPTTIALMNPETISAGYIEQNRQMHENEDYGSMGYKWTDVVIDIKKSINAESVLDYGCLESLTVVETEDGPQHIRDIVRHRYEGKVLSLSESGDFVWSQVVGWSAKPNSQNKQWVRIGIAKGKTRPVCTADHPVASITDVLNPLVKFLPANQLAGKFVIRMPSPVGHNMRRENPLYNREQVSALLGIGMGDGYFDKLGRLYNSHGLQQELYTRFKCALLGGTVIRVPPSRTGKSKSDGLFFHCPTTVQTKKIRDILYPEGKKTPDNVLCLLDEIALAFWYMDDGRLKIIEGQPYAELHTEGFQRHEQETLSKWFEERWGIGSSVYSIRATGHQFLHLNRVGSQKFFKLIAPFMHSSMAYKLPSGTRASTHVFNHTPLAFSAQYVADVKPLPRKRSKLYDLTIKYTHNFVAGRTVVHNCGKGALANKLPFPIWEYDPAIPGKDAVPRPADLVICTDVLEHVEPAMLDNTLRDLSRCVLKAGYFVIHTGAAKKTLPDGRNTHLIQEGEAWWREKLAKYFDVNKIITKRMPELIVVVGPKKQATTPVPFTSSPASRRWHVLEGLVKQHGWTKGVEVGVKEGFTFLHLLQTCPNLDLTGVDIFKPRPGLEAEGGESHENANLPQHEIRLRQTVNEMYKGRAKLIRAYSVQAAKKFKSESLDFVFIDADHREDAVRADISAWLPKARKGGMLCGHDAQDKFPGVIAAIDALCPGWQKHPDSVWTWQVR